MKFSQYHLSTDELNDWNMPNKRIIFSTRSGTSILLEEPIYQQAIKNDFSSIPKEIYNTLLSKEFIVPQDQDEYQHVVVKNKQKREEANFLSMTIQPTANCQLGCHYCGQTHSTDYAKDDVIEKYVERIESIFSKKTVYNGLSITWYGGEPLMGYSSIVKASKKMRAACESRGFHYMSNMITNGVSLKPKLFEELVNTCRVTNYQITLDGTAKSHNQRRVTKKGGAGTFDIIIKNILAVTSMPLFEEENCGITIRVNIDKTNSDEVEALIDFINDNKLQGKVSIYFAPITDFGGNDASKDSLSLEDFAQREIDWLFKCYEYGISISEILPRRSYSVCMVQNEDSEVWDAYGNIYTCWEFPYTEYSSDEHKIGNLFKPEETYNKNATLRNWAEVVDKGDVWCKTCELLPVCNGGCPKIWEEGNPACPPFKSNYKEKLALDYFIRKSADETEENKDLISA